MPFFWEETRKRRPRGPSSKLIEIEKKKKKSRLMGLMDRYLEPHDQVSLG